MKKASTDNTKKKVMKKKRSLGSVQISYNKWPYPGSAAPEGNVPIDQKELGTAVKDVRARALLGTNVYYNPSDAYSPGMAPS